MAAGSHGHGVVMKSKDAIPFRGFDERGDVRIYHHGILPHWRQNGCTYFVTYRLADALPQSVLRELEHERRLWLERHGIDPDDPHWRTAFAKLAKRDQREYERHLGVNLNTFLDTGYGACSLRESNIRKIVVDSLDYFHEVRVLTGDFVVMPNHIHVLLRPLPGFELEDVLQSLKSFTANRINRLLKAAGVFWQRDSYDHIVRDFEQLEAFREYIRANPVKAKLQPDEFTWSAASYYPEP